jgi:iron(III) transport system ATP-binding protein
MGDRSDSEPPVLEITRVRKNYQALRPLRLNALTIARGERVALIGIDAGGAEVLVNLVTGAGLPDEGEVQVLGRSTASISDGDEWLASLDRFGIISSRAVLLEGSTVEQNLAMPFTLEIDPVPPETASRVAALAEECGIAADGGWLKRKAGEAPPEIRARVHLARAVALHPALLLLEHPTASIPEEARPALGSDLLRVAETRRLAALVITQDESFAMQVGHRVLKLQGATGALKPVRKRWLTL